MGNTRDVMTSHGGSSHVPTPAERAQGYGSHLDLRVFEPGKQISGPDKNSIPNITNEEWTAITSDMEQIRVLTPDERETNYYAERAAVAARGPDAVAQFDKTYPAKDFVTQEDIDLPALGEIDDLKKYSGSDLLKIVQRDTVTWDQVKSKLGNMADLSAEEIIDLGKASGATSEEVKAFLKQGGLGPFFDKWDDEDTKDYLDKVYK